MAGRDLYAELGVGRAASRDEIKKAYRGLAKELHPDVNPGDSGAEERFKRVSHAHDVLSNEKKRALYDQFGEVGLQDGFDPARQWGGPGGRGIDPSNFSEMFGNRGRGGGFPGGLEDLFSGGLEDLIGGRGRRARPQPVKGEDMEQGLTIAFEDAVLGSDREISILSGGRRSTLKVKIPPGTEDGARMRLGGKGHPGRGGPAGDMILEVRVLEHAHLNRQGNDLAIDIPITVGEALHGANVRVPTLEGSVNLRIPPKVQGGAKLRLRAKGVPVKNGGRGDLLVRLVVRLPWEAGESCEEAVASLEGQYTEDVRAGFSEDS